MGRPVVAIVGRPNVGKSTFFNRVLGRTQAVVDDTPGITRDRHYALVDWSGSSFYLVDTGGWVPESEEAMDRRILEQVFVALKECELVLFLVDAREGLTPHDAEIARQLRRQGLPLLVVANKADSDRIDLEVGDFARLGFAEDVIAISALQGRGMGDLLDEVVRRLPPRQEGAEEEAAIRIAVLGRPNVGKSSLVNRLLGEERMIVDDRPGTTRDAIDAPFRYHNRTMVLVDTAGIRRKLGSHPDFEFYATLRAIRSLESADVALLILDATQPITRQDVRIAKMIEDAGRSCVWVFNKWDLVEKDDKTAPHLLESVREEIAFQSYAPAEFVSALTVQRVSRLPERVLEVHEAARFRVSTGELNACVRRAVEQNPPRSVGGERPIRIYYATQVRVAPPTFALYVSQPQRLAKEYERYLSREIRTAFGFVGSPIRLTIRKST
jgi:GTP-binding protein